MLVLVVPALLNRLELLRVRLAYALIFCTVIVNCTTNVLVLKLENTAFVPVVFLLFFIPLLFGPCVYYYVKQVLGSVVSRWLWVTVIPGLVNVGYGAWLLGASHSHKQQVLEKIIAGDHLLFNLTNLITLGYIVGYCVKSWLFIRSVGAAGQAADKGIRPLKKKWCRELVMYLFANVLIFMIAHPLAVAKRIPVSTMDLDLVWMPVFMGVAYLLIAMRSLMMSKEYEHQLALMQLETEQRIHQQRLEIAKDLHDSLGAHLTLINSVADSLKQDLQDVSQVIPDKIGHLASYADRTMVELRNALWALHVNDIDLAMLNARIANHLSQINEAQGHLRCICQFTVEYNRIIPAKMATNLLRIIQEFVNNSIKHARAGSVWVDVLFRDNVFILNLRDDGVGFDWDARHQSSYGLTSMQHRVQDMGGEFRVLRDHPEGTAYRIELHLAS